MFFSKIMRRFAARQDWIALFAGIPVLLFIADHDLIGAQHNLGVMYASGQGVPRDFAKAVKWYRRAASEGNAKSKYNLGVMYYEGQGVPQNYVLAHMWLELSSAQDFGQAEDLITELAERMTPEQIAEAHRLARDWVARHG